MTIKVIYILGAGSSGSTLLSLLLGAHSRMVNVGEISHIDRYRSLDLNCGCGERVSKCSFWSKVFSTKDLLAPVKPNNSLYKLLRFRSDCTRQDPHFIEIINRNMALYNRIVAQSNKEIIVDSSKDIVRLYYLFRAGEINVAPVFLVRDGRAYINSLRKRLGMSAFRSMFRWVRLNLYAEWFIRKIMGGRRLKNKNFTRFVENKVLHLSYEELTQRPEKTLEKIFEKLGLESEDIIRCRKDMGQHAISGTKRKGPIGKIRPDKTWETELSFFSKIVFVLMGGNYWNYRFGIKKLDKY